MRYWLVLGVLFACGEESGGPPELVFGPAQTVTMGGGDGAYSFDLTAGVVFNDSETLNEDISLASNLTIATRENGYLAAVGPVDSLTDIVFPAADGFAGDVDAPPGEGIAMRVADGCPAVVRVIEHTDTGLSGGNTMTFEYARALCVPVTLTIHPLPANVTCLQNQLRTGGPTVVIEIEGYPAITRAIGSPYVPIRDPETFALSVPPGVRVTATLRDSSPSTPATATWSGACAGSTCSLPSDGNPSAEANVTWTPVCFPGG